MKKVFGLALIASLFAAPAFAGETFVRNEDFSSHSETNTDLNIDSLTTSTRHEDYGSWAEKKYVDGKIDLSTCKYYCGSEKLVADKFTIHTAGSDLKGSFNEENTTTVWGTIKTVTNSYTDGHESSAGVR
jgi:hypothetical protein